MSNELSRTPPDGGGGMSIFNRTENPIALINEMGVWLQRSQLFGIQTAEQGKVLALACIAEQKNPLDIARRYHIIEGSLSMRADAMLAEFRLRGGRHRIIQRDEDGVRVAFDFEGQSIEFSITWEEAQQQDYVWGKMKDGKRELKKNWSTGRKRMQMMYARVVSDAVRALCPEVNLGMYTPEEIQDFDRPSAVQPPAPANEQPADREARRAELLSTASAAPPEYAEQPTVERDPQAEAAEMRAELDAFAETATEQPAAATEAADDVIDVESEPAEAGGSEPDTDADIGNPDGPHLSEQMDAIKEVAFAAPLSFEKAQLGGLIRETMGCHPRELTQAQAADFYARLLALRDQAGNATSQPA